ncbi:hypothetical protein [Marinilactibacillus psychrotolerans]|nr:hypothetical protein [Marinilactibacillus psychrotolerans]GEL67266.1 hypothetical protein MPS01_14210 [Marinilactibacillus psychrotolerans]SDC62342.1 hypothetical protein SAMN04488013_10781 [Marinilactibacillus psychrotolerans]
MKEEVRLLTPDKMGYKDRGIMKWQGMILSEQKDYIRKMKAEALKADIQPKEEMTEEEIAEVLYTAYVTKLPVVIQAAILKNGLYYPDVIGMVMGFAQNKVVLDVRKKDGSNVEKRVTLDMIRNVELYDILKWKKLSK